MMMNCNFKTVPALVLSLVVTIHAASEKGAKLSALETFANEEIKNDTFNKFEMDFLKAVFGRSKWESICKHIAANKYEKTIKDEETALIRLIELLREAKAKYMKLDKDDILRKPGTIGGCDFQMRRIFYIVIYMYTVDVPHPKVFAAMNAFGRQRIAPNANGHITEVDAGTLGIYSKYAGLLNSAITFLQTNNETTCTAYRGINKNLKTCTKCAGTGIIGQGLPAENKCKDCNGVGIDEFNLSKYITMCQGAGGFASASLSRAKAHEFAAGLTMDVAGSHRVLVVFLDTNQGVPIAKYSSLPNEQEVLFHPRTNHVLDMVATTTIYGGEAVLIVLKDSKKSPDTQKQQLEKIAAFQGFINARFRSISEL